MLSKKSPAAPNVDPRHPPAVPAALLPSAWPSPGERDALPGVLAALLRTRVALAWLLLKTAPLPVHQTEGNQQLEWETRYERYINSPEVETICLLFYMLRAFGVSGEAQLRKLFELHNNHMDELANDREYLLYKCVPKSKFTEAKFPPGAVENAVKNLVYHGRVALDATSVSRLTVEMINHNQANEAMNLLAHLGYFHKAQGAFAAKLYVSTGRLEMVFRTSLSFLARAVGGAGCAVHDAAQGGDGRGDDVAPIYGQPPAQTSPHAEPVHDSLVARLLAHRSAAEWGLLIRVKDAGAVGH